MILGSALLSLLLSKSPIFGIGSIFWLFICALNERESERKKEMVKEKRWDWKCVTMRPLAFPPLSCKCTTVAKISKWRLHRIWMELKVLYMSFERFLLAAESRDLSQADKSIIRVSSFSILQNFNFWMITVMPKKTIWHLARFCKIFLSFSGER